MTRPRTVAALEAEATQEAFEEHWRAVCSASADVIRVVEGRGIHLRTAAGLQVLFDASHLPALRAVVALLEGRR